MIDYKMIDYSNGSYVKVLGICGSYKENWIGRIKDNTISVESISVPFLPKRTRVSLDQVIDVSDGWQIGSQVLLKDGSRYTITQTPKIALTWMKKTNKGYLPKFYKSKVELAAISRNVDL